MLALLTLLRPLLPYLAGLLILGGIYGYGYHNGSHAANVKLETLIASQREAVRQIQSAWDKELAMQEVNILRTMEHRQLIFDPLITRAHALPPELAHIVVPPVATDILRDAINAANEVTGPPAVPDQAPAADTSVADLTQWAVDVLAIDRECRDRLEAWTSFYRGLQAAQAAKE